MSVLTPLKLRKSRSENRDGSGSDKESGSVNGSKNENLILFYNGENLTA